MKTRESIRKEIIKFLKESNICAYDLLCVGKDLCCCRTCKYFVQHYAKNDKVVDFGHCRKHSIPKPKRPHDGACGFWDIDEDE